jgi:hypothetical protein
MAINNRQIEHIERAQLAAKLGAILFAICNQLVESHAEEFSAGQSNEILSEDLEANYFFDITAFNAAINQFCQNYVDLWTNQPVATREYGKDARAIIAHSNIRLPNVI